MVLQPAPTTNTALILCLRASHNDNILFYQAAVMQQCTCVDTNVLVHEYIHIRLIMIYNALAILEPYYIIFIYVPPGYLLTAAAFLRLFSSIIAVNYGSKVLFGRLVLPSRNILSLSKTCLLLTSLTSPVDSTPAAALVQTVCCCY